MSVFNGLVHISSVVIIFYNFVKIFFNPASTRRLHNAVFSVFPSEKHGKTAQTERNGSENKNAYEYIIPTLCISNFTQQRCSKCAAYITEGVK